MGSCRGNDDTPPSSADQLAALHRSSVANFATCSGRPSDFESESKWNLVSVSAQTSQQTVASASARLLENRNRAQLADTRGVCVITDRQQLASCPQQRSHHSSTPHMATILRWPTSRSGSKVQSSFKCLLCVSTNSRDRPLVAASQSPTTDDLFLPLWGYF